MRTLHLVIGTFIIASSVGACSSSETSASPAGDLGKPCGDDSMCSGLSCRKDTRGLGQCSIECNSDDPCVAKFGKGSSCSTAQHSCVKLCADDSGCPAYTKCDATAHFCYRP